MYCFCILCWYGGDQCPIQRSAALLIFGIHMSPGGKEYFCQLLTGSSMQSRDALFIHRAQERASRKARMVLEGLAMPLPAMLKAVPWSGLVR